MKWFHGHIVEIPEGAVDGTNTIFILSETPDTTANIRIFINGLQQFINVDYTIQIVLGKTTIVLNEAPLNTGGKIDDIHVEYTYEE